MNTQTATTQQPITALDVNVNSPCSKACQLTADDRAKTDELRFLDINQVATKISKGKSTIYDWLNKHSPRYDPSFPEPVKLNDKSVAWIFSEVEGWMISKIALSRGETNGVIITPTKLE